MPTTRKSIINMKTIAVMLVIAVLFSGFIQIRWNELVGMDPGNPKIPLTEELYITTKSIPGEPVCVPDSPARSISLLSDKMSFSPGFNPYYEYTSYGLLNPTSLNLSFDPHTSWGGRIYLYSENHNFGNILEKYHNVSTYKYLIIKNGYQNIKHLPNKNILNETYEIYINGAYSILYVDHTSEAVSRTRVWF